MATPNIHLGESFLDRLVKDTYNKNSLGELSADQMNELTAYMQSDDFKTKSSTFRSKDRSYFEGSVDYLLGKDTQNKQAYLSHLANPRQTKYLIPQLTSDGTNSVLKLGTGLQTTSTQSNKPINNESLQESHWLNLATDNGFSSLDDVKNFQKKVGLAETGQLDDESLARLQWYNTMKEKGYKEKTGDRGFYFNGSGYNYYYTNDKNKYDYTTLPQAFHLSDFAAQNNLTDKKIENGRSYYRYDPDGVGDFYVDQFGNIYNAGTAGSIGTQLNENSKFGSKTVEQQYYNLLEKIFPKKKQGGLLNTIQYFKNGNTMQQQDIQQQIKALVRLAMQKGQEAEKAQKTIQTIMQKADQGDPQAMQLAQLINNELQQVQGQATSAKWGSKLSYIRSLKYAQGGKACPACKKDAPVKVEEKACGGKTKKAKKRYFGGWL